ncbi:MAG: segregation and condensation protein A [Pseudomonadota bacterium]
MMDFEDLSKDQKILMVMRKTLTSVIKDTTPNPGMIHPLSETTVENIKLCLSLISSREREINKEMGNEQEFRPRFVDEATGAAKQDAQVIKFHPKTKQ